MLPIAFTA